ncbi:MAG: GNAT family N-acetyltransferase, partial [Candidatus Diapherotrites archaeon]|nr:GNAT family N-acetyltransferase [Candidatus Diapherotrites archaeon]
MAKPEPYSVVKAKGHLTALRKTDFFQKHPMNFAVGNPNDVILHNKNVIGSIHFNEEMSKIHVLVDPKHRRSLIPRLKKLFKDQDYQIVLHSLKKNAPSKQVLGFPKPKKARMVHPKTKENLRIVRAKLEHLQGIDALEQLAFAGGPVQTKKSTYEGFIRQHPKGALVALNPDGKVVGAGFEVRTNDPEAGDMGDAIFNSEDNEFYGGYNPSKGKFSYLYSMAVHPEYRGFGLAHRLREGLIHGAARDASVKGIYSHTHDTSSVRRAKTEEGFEYFRRSGNYYSDGDAIVWRASNHLLNEVRREKFSNTFHLSADENTFDPKALEKFASAGRASKPSLSIIPFDKEKHLNPVMKLERANFNFDWQAAKSEFRRIAESLPDGSKVAVLRSPDGNEQVVGHIGAIRVTPAL